MPLRALALTLLSGILLAAQDRVGAGFQNERIIVIVPMVGAGTEEDPIRPMFVPKPSENLAPDASQFLSVKYELSDDGQTAVVEFVARNKTAFKKILASREEGVKVFERGKHTKADLEREFRKVGSEQESDRVAVWRGLQGS
jgi:hypothetical protein